MTPPLSTKDLGVLLLPMTSGFLLTRRSFQRALLLAARYATRAR